MNLANSQGSSLFTAMLLILTLPLPVFGRRPP